MAGIGVIDIPVNANLMQALHRFLSAAADGASLHQIQRNGETILYFRKNSRLADKLAETLLHGKAADKGRSARNPVLRLVSSQTTAYAEHGDAASPKRRGQLQRLDQRVPGAISSNAARSLARRGQPPTGQPGSQ